MKKVKKLLVAMTVFLMIFCIAVPVSAAGKINKSKATLTVGKTLKLKVSGVKGKAKWTSSKKSVATVSNSGKVTAKKAGKATITAKIGKKKYSCKVTVKKASTNGGFNGSTSTAKNIVTYHAESTPYGAVAILENHYDYAVDLRVEFVYFLNGSMVGTEAAYNYAFAPHTKCAMQGWNSDKTWDSFKINLKIEKASSNIILNNSGIHYSANFGSKNVMVKVDNRGRKNYTTNIGVVFYKNGRIVGYNYQYPHVENPGATSYLEFAFPYDRNYDTITPDKFEIYVNNSYTYDWMK